ncbi:MAG: hypothetical protein RLZZ450_4114 [Pseudomonadota bacterium]
MQMASRVCVAAWLLTLLVASSSAHGQSEAALDKPEAQPPPQGYREAVEQALEDLRSGYFSEARGMFARAHELMPSAKTLWGLGMAEFEMRSYVDSIGHLQKALDSEVRPLAAEQRRQAETLLERARRYVTRVTLEVSPNTARVELDGAQQESRELLLAVGDHSLEIAASGFVPQRRALHALGGDAQQVSVVLLPEVAALPAAPLPVARERDDRARPLWKNPWLWTGVGVLVVGAAVTGGVLAARRGADGGEAPYGGSANVSLEAPL